MTLGDGKTQTDQPADWGRERERERGGKSEVRGMTAIERNRRMDAMDLAFKHFVLCCVYFIRDLLHLKKKLKQANTQTHNCVKVSFLTCGSRGADEWRWGCRWRASSAGEIASRFWSPASGHSSGRSFAPGSPCTRYALTPGSPDSGNTVIHTCHNF